MCRKYIFLSKLNTANFILKLLIIIKIKRDTIEHAFLKVKEIKQIIKKYNYR